MSHPLENVVAAVRGSLDARGVLAKIRAELRMAVFSAIDETERANGVHLENKNVALLNSNAEARAALAVVLDFLQRYGFTTSRSCLLEECGLPPALLPVSLDIFKAYSSIESAVGSIGSAGGEGKTHHGPPTCLLTDILRAADHGTTHVMSARGGQLGAVSVNVGPLGVAGVSAVDLQRLSPGFAGSRSGPHDEPHHQQHHEDATDADDDAPSVFRHLSRESEFELSPLSTPRTGDREGVTAGDRHSFVADIGAVGERRQHSPPPTAASTLHSNVFVSGNGNINDSTGSAGGGFQASTHSAGVPISGSVPSGSVTESKDGELRVEVHHPFPSYRDTVSYRDTDADLPQDMSSSVELGSPGDQVRHRQWAVSSSSSATVDVSAPGATSGQSSTADTGVHPSSSVNSYTGVNTQPTSTSSTVGLSGGPYSEVNNNARVTVGSGGHQVRPLPLLAQKDLGIEVAPSDSSRISSVTATSEHTSEAAMGDTPTSYEGGEHTATGSGSYASSGANSTSNTAASTPKYSTTVSISKSLGLGSDLARLARELASAANEEEGDGTNEGTNEHATHAYSHQPEQTGGEEHDMLEHLQPHTQSQPSSNSHANSNATANWWRGDGGVSQPSLTVEAVAAGSNDVTTTEATDAPGDSSRKAQEETLPNSTPPKTQEELDAELAHLLGFTDSDSSVFGAPLSGMPSAWGDVAMASNTHTSGAAPPPPPAWSPLGQHTTRAGGELASGTTTSTSSTALVGDGVDGTVIGVAGRVPVGALGSDVTEELAAHNSSAEVDSEVDSGSEASGSGVGDAQLTHTILTAARTPQRQRHGAVTEDTEDTSGSFHDVSSSGEDLTLSRRYLKSVSLSTGAALAQSQARTHGSTATATGHHNSSRVAPALATDSEHGRAAAAGITTTAAASTTAPDGSATPTTGVSGDAGNEQKGWTSERRLSATRFDVNAEPFRPAGSPQSPSRTPSQAPLAPFHASASFNSALSGSDATSQAASEHSSSQGASSRTDLTTGTGTSRSAGDSVTAVQTSVVESVSVLVGFDSPPQGAGDTLASRAGARSHTHTSAHNTSANAAHAVVSRGIIPELGERGEGVVVDYTHSSPQYTDTHIHTVRPGVVAGDVEASDVYDSPVRPHGVPDMMEASAASEAYDSDFDEVDMSASASALSLPVPPSVLAAVGGYFSHGNSHTSSSAASRAHSQTGNANYTASNGSAAARSPRLADVSEEIDESIDDEASLALSGLHEGNSIVLAPRGSSGGGGGAVYHVGVSLPPPQPQGPADSEPGEAENEDEWF